MAYARSSFGKRGGPATAGARPRPRAQQDDAATPDGSPLDAINVTSVKALVFGEDMGFSDFKAQPAAWICGGIIALMVMTTVLSFGFGFGTLFRSHNMVFQTVSGLVLFATAALAMAGAVYGGSMLAEKGRRHDLRFAILVLVFAVELLLFLVGEALGAPKGVSWLLFGAVVAGPALWARLRYDRIVANVAELTANAG